MKKILLAASITLMTVACKKTETPTSPAIAEQRQNPEAKNEMVALMDEMMDEMHADNQTGNIDADFSRMMIEHHKGAVEMSELLLQKGKDDRLKTFAGKVIGAQNSEISLMKKFGNETGGSDDSRAFQKELNRSMAAMMDKNIKIHNDIDRDYAEQMIPHHQSAVDMAEVYLKYGKQKELLTLSRHIVNAQTAEVAQLKQWLQNN